MYIYVRLYIHPSVPTRSCTEHAAARGGAPPAAEGGAYPGQRGDRGGVPRADVRVERRRRLERLRAEPPAVHADGKALARFGADASAPGAHARARAHGRTRAARVHAHACFSQQYTYTYMCIIYMYGYNRIM